jgi:hypothetical protein
MYTITAGLHDAASLDRPDAIVPVAKPLAFSRDLTIDLAPYTVVVVDVASN